MAEGKVPENLDRFRCLICSELLKEPVSVPCGHTFCMTCISAQWDGAFRRGVYICPVCKHCFSPRPILQQNIMLAEMLERLKRTLAFEGTFAGPEDVECDSCIGRKHKALKSCLNCVASYCELHYQLHQELNPGNTHKVTETRYSLRERMCSRHNRLQNILCCTENSAVCSQCTLSQCKNHNIVTFRRKRAEQQLKIPAIQSQVLRRTEAALKSITDLKEAIESIKTSAQTSLEQSEKILVELICSAERKRSEIRGLIRATEAAEVQRAETSLKLMEQEVAKLKERDNKLDQLAQLDDDFLFVLHYPSMSDFSTFDGLKHVRLEPSPLKEIQDSVSELEAKVKEFYMTGPGNGSHMVFTSAPIVREDFIQYFCQLAVDPSQQ